MARLARSSVVGYPHHVIQRGNYDQPVFGEDVDYKNYLRWLPQYSVRYGVDIWAYCLMPNHVHFICVPKAVDALARTFNTLHMKYAQYFHGKKGVRGHLWRGRFLSCIMDDKSVLEEVRFIENDPIRSGLVARAEDYPWSSARHHVLGEPDAAVRGEAFLKSEIKDWRVYLAADGDGPLLERTWRCLKTGRPAGDDAFVHFLEGIVGRRLLALPRGRPRKVNALNGPPGKT